MEKRRIRRYTLLWITDKREAASAAQAAVMAVCAERITENMEDFFRELEESLRGEVSENEIRDSLNYYRQYFEEQKAMGYSESEIITSLGSPRLIARSIIDAREAVSGQDSQMNYGGQSSYYGNGQETQGGYYDAEEGRYSDYEDEQAHMRVRKVGGLKLVFGIIFVLIILGLLIRVLIPVVVVLIPVLIVFRLIRGRQ